MCRPAVKVRGDRSEALDDSHFADVDLRQGRAEPEQDRDSCGGRGDGLSTGATIGEANRRSERISQFPMTLAESGHV